MNKIFFLLIIFIGVFPTTTHAAATAPKLPGIYLDTKYKEPTGRILNVSNTAELQKALNDAQGGDQIVMIAGNSFLGPVILPKKSNKDMIILRTSQMSGIPDAGQRVSPQNAAAMPKILAPGRNQVALSTEAGAHHYRLIGIEFGKLSPTVVAGELVSLGQGDQKNLEDVPRDIILDRVYIHGDPSSDLKRGVGLHSALTSIIDSYISDIHVVGQDAQAIAGYSGPGPYKISNNFVEASGENILFGGADPKIPNLVPTDIEITNNLLSKPLSWREKNSKHWAVKNLFELKNAQRVLVSGNTMENNWVDGQTGYAVLFTPRNQSGSCNWCTVLDVTFKNNIVRNSAAGIQILAEDNYNPSGPITSRIEISNNLFENIDGPKWGGGNGWFLLITGHIEGPHDVQVVHNTVKQTGTAINAGQFKNGKFVPKNNFVFTENIIAHNEYGIKGDSDGIGDPVLNHYFPGAVFERNILVGGNPNYYKQYADNHFPKSWEEVSQDKYKNLGANIDQITQAQAQAFSPSANQQSQNNPVVITGIGSDSPIYRRSFQDGSVVKGTSPTVYLVQQQTLRAFTSAQSFFRHGFQFSQVKVVNDSDLFQVPLGSFLY